MKIGKTHPAKKVIFVADSLGGGVGRVITVLINGLKKNGYAVDVITVRQNTGDVKTASSIMGFDRYPTVLPSDQKKNTFFSAVTLLVARVIGKICVTFLHRESDRAAILKYRSRHDTEIRYLTASFRKNRGATIIAFLNDAICLTLLAKKYKNKVIISERNDPQQFTSKTIKAFFRKKFCKADQIVFQSPDVQKWYQDRLGLKGTVIFNPIKEDLPKPFAGIRQKKIVNFCRISSQKNLILLLDAYALLQKDHPEYELYIYGDAIGNGTDGYTEQIKTHIQTKNLTNQVHLLPAQKNIHELVLDHAMFVSSSDFEGMSNSMLEAMAIGLPTICTDCPAGGARAVIKDHENGILVPVGDCESLYAAMKEVIENPDLAKKLSANGTKIREEQSSEKIIRQWLELF